MMFTSKSAHRALTTVISLLFTSAEQVSNMLISGHTLVTLSPLMWMIKGCTALISQINNVLCFLRYLESVTKTRSVISYCYSLYGCITQPCIEHVCSEWRSGIRRV